MQKAFRIPTWLIGAVAAWLLFTITLSVLHLYLLNQWGVPYSIRIYSLDPSEPFSLPHALLVALISPGFFFLQVLAFLHIHIFWLDAAIYNWGTMVILSSLPVFLIGGLATAQNPRAKLTGAILAILVLGGSILYVLNSWLMQ